jgi:tetratricopeptide (TPR) repeat protein
MSYQILQRASRQILVACALVALASGGAFALVVPKLPAESTVSAKDQKRAEIAYGKAYEAYGNGDTEGALKQANRAFKALPNASTALIRATILSAMNRTRKAFEAYLVAADLNPVPDELQLIDAGLAQTGAALTPPMGWTSFKTTPTGAKVALGEGSFKAPRTVGLPAGQHYFNISAVGHVGTAGNVTVNAGRGSNLSFALAAAQRQEAVVRTSPVVEARPSPPRTTAAAVPSAAATKAAAGPGHTLSYTLMGVGGGAMIGGIVSYVGALNAIGKANEATNEADYNKFNDEAASSQAMAFGLLGVGAAVLGYGVWSFLDAPDDASTAQWQATPLAMPGGGALVVSGRF